jgi:hypothetical protein
MTAAQYRAHIARLGFPSPYAAAPALGISARTSQRYASGELKVSDTVAILLALLDDIESQQQDGEADHAKFRKGHK